MAVAEYCDQLRDVRSPGQVIYVIRPLTCSSNGGPETTYEYPKFKTVADFQA